MGENVGLVAGALGRKMAPVASKVVKAWSWWTFGATDFRAKK